MTATLAVAVLGLLLLPPGDIRADTGVLPATGSVSVVSALGQETMPLSGTATIQWGSPHVSGGVLVVDTELTALSLTGNSVTGPVSVVESGSQTSSGRNAGSFSYVFPASTYFDVYIIATVPASPNPTIVLQNNTAIHLTAPAVYQWPPLEAIYTANPNPCIPLFPALPMQACINAMSFTVSAPPGVGGSARLSGIDVPPLATKATVPGVVILAAFFAGVAVVAAMGAAAWWTRRRSRS